MNALIFAGGNITDYDFIEKYEGFYDIIICADSGALHALNAGLKPDYLIGDMDSISEDVMERVKKLNTEIICYPKEKDFTDTELALEYALKLGVKSAVILAGVGTRPDHSLANIFLLVRYLEKGIDLVIADRDFEIFVIRGEKEINGEKGGILSLIPLKGDAEEIYTEGLYYPLRGESLLFGTSRGISNVFIKEKAKIKVGRGILLGIKINSI